MSETSQPQTLAGRVALVTGAGGGGVGSATARLLAARGAGVVVNYRQSREAAERIVAEIGGGGRRAIAVQADVGEEGDVERMVARALEELGRVDVLVSNAPAGAPRVAGFEELGWEGFATAFTGRVRAAFLTTRAVLPAMRAQGGGRLIYVGSDHADGPAAPGMIANGSGSAALVAFVRYLAHELGGYGITANVVSPGGIDSPGSRAARQRFLPPDFDARMAAAVPLGRLATPEDVARVIAFFAGEDSAFMTGTVAHVNGGSGIARFAGARSAAPATA